MSRSAIEPVNSPREYALIAALQCIVLETMQYAPASPISGDSFLPNQLLEQAQQALGAYGLRCMPRKPQAMRVETDATDTSFKVPTWLARAT